MNKKNRNMKKYLLTLFGMFLAFTLITGYTNTTDNIQAAAKAEELENSLVQVAENVKLSVVSITTVKVFKHPPTGRGHHGDGHGRRDKRNKKQNPFDFFGDDFFDKFIPRPPEGEFKTQNLGSGVLVKIDGENGYILTNNHVVADTDELKVKLGDKREFVAEIVGTDEQTDLAVIKITGKNLVAVRMGDSDEMKPGQWAIAIGNPFGLTHTVSVGVVSAVGRSGVGIANYENFIQTDAAINPGNSGGPLVNIKGEVIGVNTAIFTRTGGYQGIGFAIPINMAKAVLRDLIEKGRVTRGWLGVVIQDLDSSLAEQFGVDVVDGGVLISDVQDNSPADEAGFERGDIVIEYDHKKMADINELRNSVAQTKVGEKIKVKVLRKGKEETLTVKIGEQPSDLFATSALPTGKDLGMTVQDLTEELAGNMGYEGENGVLVSSVEPGSPATQADIKEGDLIKEINREKIADVKGFKKALKDAGKDRDILLLIRRGMHTRFVIIKKDSK